MRVPFRTLLTKVKVSLTQSAEAITNKTNEQYENEEYNDNN